MRASIWYRVQYPIVEDAPTPIITFYYNGQNSTNLRDKCNTDGSMHGQLYNKDLAVPLIEKYRENFWCWSVYDETWNCHGDIQIQDFKPTSYSFSIGYKCGDTEGNLEGLEYKVTISDEVNKTRCMDLARKYSDVEQENMIDYCKPSYQYAAFPNPLGNTDLQEAAAEMNSLMNFALNHTNEKCLSKLQTFLCEIILPKCLPEENEILLPCRDTCKSLLEDCSPDYEFNCDYLPLCQGRISVIIEEDTPWFLSKLSVRPSHLQMFRSFALVVIITVCCVICRKKMQYLSCQDACESILQDSSTDNLPPCPPNYVLLICLSVGTCLALVVDCCVKYIRKKMSFAKKNNREDQESSELVLRNYQLELKTDRTSVC